MRREAVPDDSGASAVEYGLIVFAIAAVITLAVFAFGGQVRNLFGDTCDSVAKQSSAATSCG
jgi:pilus assembly protein Flp/PilA